MKLLVRKVLESFATELGRVGRCKVFLAEIFLVEGLIVMILLFTCLSFTSLLAKEWIGQIQKLAFVLFSELC